MTRNYRRFHCTLCSHIYDEAVGDPQSNIAPGTRFADLPDDWVCPDCGATKADYEPMD